ncbi:IclR family transcriptional regulator [Glaciimonas immobilis]|uniref:DNA-binding IclR family transcriptional regulator n=1 Tax=Glaciimonas immobilis TaxID=728004 RepID=A0A840RJU7_9BURK|nr:IclR family transcriptional regulator [Glaciimonas immobilis]KAF3999040.1 IclR family transcriptional regulator [Glaciimonas immobilis]MBB5198467.1 DNA-binding IclR family transcriptional regulator [Glaciimonas immobilis]
MTTSYTNVGQQRILKLLLLLFGHEMNGVTLTDVAKWMDTAPPVALRDLHNLQDAGMAEQIVDTNRWRLTPRLPQKALAMLEAMDRAQQRVTETRNRYSRTPD